MCEFKPNISRLSDSESQLILVDEEYTVIGPTRTEIAVRFCESLIENMCDGAGAIHSVMDTIPVMAVSMTDILIAELKKEKPDAG